VGVVTRKDLSDENAALTLGEKAADFAFAKVRVRGLGFRVQGLGFRVYDSGFRVKDLGHSPR
jgi:hypothetical protein